MFSQETTLALLMSLKMIINAYVIIEMRWKISLLTGNYLNLENELFYICFKLTWFHQLTLEIVAIQPVSLIFVTQKTKSHGIRFKIY